ncbi:MAG: hypothetical protein QOF14_5695 [Hyphomicrobiales bacterium]|nr:hypothetical protein [Hyphomicrobiales bacterium]
MTTATFSSLPSVKPAARSAPNRGWFARFYAALVEARMRAAMREITMRRHLVPDGIVKTAEYQATVTKDGALPFTR